jgi:sulfoxide reductase heme-binding subunit YedZ
VSLLAVVFLGIHIATAVVDSYAKVGIAQVFVPLPSAKYGLLLGLGALSLDLLIAVMVTSLIRHRLSQRIWKGVHWLAYASWPIALFHSVGIGTDKASSWFVDTAVACAGLVVAAVFWRLLELRRPYPKYLGASS